MTGNKKGGQGANTCLKYNTAIQKYVAQTLHNILYTDTARIIPGGSFQ